MANSVFQIKRTSVSGRAANNTTLNRPGELALNMADGILYSTNGTTIFEIGANSTNQRVTGNSILNYVYSNSIYFSNAGIAATEGVLTWNSDESTLDLGLAGNVSVLQVGQEILYRVKNQTGSTINNGVVVMANGTTGSSGRIKVTPAIANGAFPSEYVMGVTSENITNGSDGWVIHFGKLRGFDTSPWPDGSILYADPANTGGLTATKPSAPNAKTIVAIVIHSAVNGTLFVRPTYGSSVFDDEGVEITNIANNDLLVYKTANGRFENSNTITLFGATTNSLYVTTSANLPGQFANSTGLYPLSNSVGQAFGNTLARWAITGSTITLSSTLAVSGVSTLTTLTINGTTTNMNVVTLTTGSINLGGPTQTGAINVGRSTNSQVIAIANGATISGNVKTISIGENGVSGSQTNITVGSSLSNTLLTVYANSSLFSGAVNTTTLNTGTFSAGNTTITGFINVSSNGYFSDRLSVGTLTPNNKFEVFGNLARIASRAADNTSSSFVEAQSSDYWTASNYTGTSIRQFGGSATGNSLVSTISDAGLGVLTFQNGTTGLILTNGSTPLVFATTSTESMRINPNGNVGIGTTNPLLKLDVSGSGLQGIRINSTDTSGSNIAYFTAQHGSGTSLQLRAGTGYTFLLGTGAVPLYMGTNSATHMTITGSGDVGIGTTSPSSKLQVNGSFAAITKSFVINHPTKTNMKLRYASLEGPENGVYVRGRLDGKSVIELPEYWWNLIDESTITVNLTPIGRSQDLYVQSTSAYFIYLNQPADCFFTVFAERKDVDKLVVEY